MLKSSKSMTNELRMREGFIHLNQRLKRNEISKFVMYVEFVWIVCTCRGAYQGTFSNVRLRFERNLASLKDHVNKTSSEPNFKLLKFILDFWKGPTEIREVKWPPTRYSVNIKMVETFVAKVSGLLPRWFSRKSIFPKKKNLLGIFFPKLSLLI